VAQVAVAAPFSLLDNNISDLGASTCGPIAIGAYRAGVCSPWHPVMNATFVVSGLLTAPGAVLRQEQVDGQWTVWGLSRALGVDRDWLYARIQAGTLPATKHPLVGHYLIPDDPAALDRLRQLRPPRRPT
jgi:hypothetical protein